MSTPIHAQSLSSLTQLLSNPPRYPRNPAHEAHKPLVLYIVRVPGSKDVFLSPLKPPTKASISLEAIQSSLYYLHVDSAEDEEVRQSIDQERQLVSNENIAPPVNRKPLPPIPHENYPPSARPCPPSKAYPYYQPGLDGGQDASQTERLVARGSHLRLSTRIEGRDDSFARRPLKPRLFQDRPLSASINRQYEPSLSGSELGGDTTSRSSSIRRKPVPGYGDENIPISTESTTPVGDHRYIEAPVPTRYEHVSAPKPSVEYMPPRPVPDTTVTIIRRDPASGVQWNVGCFYQPTTYSDDMTIKPISIDLSTPGYCRFNRQATFPRHIHTTSDPEAIKRAIAAGEFSPESPTTETDSPATFTRTVNFRQQPYSMVNKSRRHGQRTDSSDFLTNYPIPSSNKAIRSIFSFDSPWQGLCTFHNGIDGKSLKCRHALPSPNPQDETSAVNVAELRFNLPWSVLGSKDANRKRGVPLGEESDAPLPISNLLKQQTSGKETLRRSIQHFRNLSLDKVPRSKYNNSDTNPEFDRHQQDRQENNPHRFSNKEQEHEQDRISLKLGREKAGGGFKGNSAKLGKLIIEDEGLKMCDLVVAACMGVWWQHYMGHTATYLG